MDTDTSTLSENAPPPNTAPPPPSNNEAAQVPTRAKCNGKNGKSNYTREELLHLFAVMDRILPIGTEEWEQVLMEHSEVYPGRDVDSIRRKYNTLHRKQVPTGSPNITPEILAAKRVKYKIGDKADIGGGEDEVFELEKGFLETGGVADNDDGTPPSEDGSTQPGPPNLQATGRPAAPPAARAPSLATPAFSAVVSSCVPRKSKDSHQEFMEMMRMQMMLDRQERRESRRRQEEWTGLFSAVVGGIAAAFGVEVPRVEAPRSSTNMKKRKHIRNNDSDSESTGSE